MRGLDKDALREQFDEMEPHEFNEAVREWLDAKEDAYEAFREWQVEQWAKEYDDAVTEYAVIRDEARRAGDY